MRSFTALLAATLPIMADGRVQLLPSGDFRARDGRPGPGKFWRLSDAQGASIAEALNSIAAQTPIVIDYEHQTLHAAGNGQAAPAAGWIKSTQWRPGEGLYATVEWTAAAKARIDAGEYRYISPVITYDSKGTVTGVVMAALTNYPAIVGMDAVAAQLATRIDPQESDMTTLVALTVALGMPSTASEAEAIAAVSALKSSLGTAQAEITALKARPAVPGPLVTALGLAEGADEAAALAAVAALKGGDASMLGMVTALQTQIAALTTQINDARVTGIVDEAITAGKFAPAMRDHLLGMGRKDVAQLTALVAASPVIPGLSGQTALAGTEAVAGGAGGAAALTAQQTKIAASLGLDPKKYHEHLQACAA